MGPRSRNETLSGRAYTILRHRILRGEIGLGQVISRRKVASELGMSLLPVMEALVRLEMEGLLESRARAGTRVRLPTREDVFGHFVVREALETQAARLFTKQATAKERAALKKLACRVDAAWELDQAHFITLHQRFHRRIAECSHCLALVKAIEGTQALASTWMYALFIRRPTVSQGWRDHQKLVKVLAEGTPDQASANMREHIIMGFRQIMDGLEPYFKLRQIKGDTYTRGVKKSSRAVPARRSQRRRTGKSR